MIQRHSGKMHAIGFAALGLVLALTAHPLSATAATSSDDISVSVNSITADGVGDSIGKVTLRDTAAGLVIIPDLTGLPPGEHGFHLHENPACGPGEKDGKMAAGIAAGGHFDPEKTGKHLGPHGSGHKGDLPVLIVDSTGHAGQAMLAPRLKLADVHHHSFIIHAHGDNYLDTPEPLGGGGGRIACAIVP